METAVNDVATAIGSGDSESGGNQDKGEGDSDNLIGSIVDLGETTEEILGEPDGEGVIGRFGEFKDVIAEANEQVTGIADGLAAIDGQTVECTINIESDGFPAYASGTALGAMNLESTEYNAKYEGNAHVSGTANVTGNWGVRKPGKSLVGELGQELLKTIQIMINRKLNNYRADRTYQTIIKRIDKNGYVIIDQTGQERTVPCGIPNVELKPMQSVYVKEPMGNLNELHICNVVGSTSKSSRRR